VAILAAVLGLTAVPSCSKAPGAAPTGDPRLDVAVLQRTNARLQQQIDLAAGKNFYLVFDSAKPDLTLMLRGAELRRYAVLGSQVGRPRVAWFARRSVQAWQGVVWTTGTLEPLRQIDRLVVRGGEPGKTDVDVKTPPIPPTAEELYPVPSRYLIRFADGLSVEIRPREADAHLGRWARLRASLSAKWHDTGAALWAGGRDAVRLRLVLNPKDAESLYRALPPAVRLLVL
jgi:hypothetical protein